MKFIMIDGKILCGWKGDQQIKLVEMSAPTHPDDDDQPVSGRLHLSVASNAAAYLSRRLCGVDVFMRPINWGPFTLALVEESLFDAEDSQTLFKMFGCQLESIVDDSPIAEGVWPTMVTFLIRFSRFVGELEMVGVVEPH